MEAQPSRTLHQILDVKKAFTPEDAIRATVDLAVALENEHRQDRIVGGIFPDQVVINLQSGSRLLELGAVRDPDELTLSYLCFVPPECLEKQPATKQSDLYSMGVILYALLSGCLPFAATTREALVQQIKNGSAQTLPPFAARPDLEWIIRKCLLPSPDRRFVSAQELATELKKCAHPQSVVEKVSLRRPGMIRFLNQWWKALVACVGLMLILITIVSIFLMREPPPSDPLKWDLVRLTSERFEESEPSLSPDGYSIAYVSDRTGNRDLYVMTIHGTNPVQITRSPGIEENPRWSPTGTQILYTYRAPDSPPTLYSISPSGGVPQQLVSNAIDAQWSPDGKEFCYVAPSEGVVRSLLIFNLDQEEARVVLNGISGISHPSFSSNGKEIVVSISGRLELVRATSGKRSVLTDGPSDSFPTWNWKTGSIYFSSRASGSSQLWYVDENGKRTHVIRSDREDFRPIPSYSGDRVLFHRHNTLTDFLSIDKASGSVRHIPPSSGKTLFPPRGNASEHPELLPELIQASIDYAQLAGTKTVAILTPARIDLMNLDTGERTPIFHFRPGEQGRRIAWSPEGRDLYCERVRPGSDLYYIKGSL